ncbi:hypothetical protein P168DRAFT_244318 [Aspergillus campestris IBT 28561]|uniref:DUF1365-domain-containing protein n=1 Tax=Aspergillus campestris (strain IBT 28561) TaxID=1392248 RepID=A0A2I1CRW5_ASPC2|nr:uncharacterized protein P168DRAFT_244318 [Aspergillus campestris IBT 28561]PKY00357.1 hypothetical protein P168DRAFT_244318 [Aspergillus campestris IBT 28561]
MVVIPITIAVGLTTIIGTALFWLLQTAFFRRKWLPASDLGALQGNEWLGKPLLFPTKLSHSRMFPERYNYTYNYFLVGVPIGLRGRVGSVLSIDMAQPAPDDANKPTQSTKCWFKIDQRYYLEPGNHPQGLEGKLHRYLRSRGEDPERWPYAYMISIPKFLWFTRNAVSWWLLYSPTRELDAMVMEVNNSFGERKTIFMRLEGGSATNEAHKITTINNTEGPPNANFTPSISKYKMYKGNWDKDFFLSPFEKVEGYFTTTCSDPCNPHSGTKGPLHTNTTLYAPDGRPKIISRVYSWGNPLDPLSASPWSLIRFICGWGYIGALSKQRIIYEALRVRLRGNLAYLRKPEVKKTNIPREETSIERSLESFFRLFLAHAVARYPSPLTVLYHPSKSHWLVSETFHSRGVSRELPEPGDTPTVTVRVQGPSFYTSIMQYEDASVGIDTELSHFPVPAEQHSQRLWASNPTQLQEIAASTKLGYTATTNARLDWKTRVRQVLIRWLRKTPKPTFMDTFVYGHLQPSQQRGYQVALLRHLLAERFALGSHGLLRLYEHMASIAVAWVVLVLPIIATGGFSLEKTQIAANAGVIVFAGWAHLRNSL